MPAVNQLKRKGRKPLTKLCVKCGKVLPLTDFYRHKDWAAQSYRDAWCRDCAWKFCKDPETLREYCWYNNRRWSDAFYEAALKKARYSLVNNAEYLSGGTSADKKLEIEGRAACRAFFSTMNLGSVYQYSGNIEESTGLRVFNADSPAGMAIQDETGARMEDGEQVFSRVWNGLYTQREIDYLDDYYARLEDGFV